MRIFSILGLSLVLATAHDDEFHDVEIRTIPVADGVYMLEGQGGNIGVSVGLDGILIVDDQFAPLAEKIENALKALNPGPLRFVLNTHHHGDHVGGNAAFGSKGATIVAQHNVRQRLLGGETETPGLPVVTFEKSLSVHFNGQEIRLLHQGPGHTDGDSVIYFTGANVVHMGDLFFNGQFPYIDLGAGGDVDGYIESVETVLARVPADAKVIPGHGSLASVDDLRRFLQTMKETVALVRGAKADGQSLADVQAKGLPDRYDEWGSGWITAERWIETVYNDTD